MIAKRPTTIATPNPNPNLRQTIEIQTDTSNPPVRSKPATQIPTSTSQTSCSRLESDTHNLSANTFHLPPESEPSQRFKRQRDYTPNNTPKTITSYSNNSSTTASFEATKHTNTTRFQTILDTVQAAGFENFDTAVAAYYTHTFDKNSFVDLAQKTSRARRLAGVLTSLHESSANWTLWEARGYRHQVAEAAESIYSSELAQLTSSRKRKRDHRLAPRRDSPSTSELDGSSSASSTANARSQHGQERPRTSLEELQRVYQNKAWTHPILSHLVPSSRSRRPITLAAALLLNNDINNSNDNATALQYIERDSRELMLRCPQRGEWREDGFDGRRDDYDS